MALPVLPALLGGVLVSIASSVVARVLVALGVSFITYYGVQHATEYLEGLISNSLGGLPADIVAILALCKVGTCLSIYIAALTANLLMNGLNAGTFKRLIWN